MTLLLDAGAFVAVERGGPGRHRPGETGAIGPALAPQPWRRRRQIWRGGSGRQAEVARLLRGVDVRALDEELGKKAAVLLGRSWD